jgi:hypothetical protein
VLKQQLSTIIQHHGDDDNNNNNNNNNNNAISNKALCLWYAYFSAFCLNLVIQTACVIPRNDHNRFHPEATLFIILHSSRNSSYEVQRYLVTISLNETLITRYD